VAGLRLPRYMAVTAGWMGRDGKGDSNNQVMSITTLRCSGAVWAALKPENTFFETLKVFWEVWVRTSPLPTRVTTEANKYQRCP